MTCLDSRQLKSLNARCTLSCGLLFYAQRICRRQSSRKCARKPRLRLAVANLLRLKYSLVLSPAYTGDWFAAFAQLKASLRPLSCQCTRNPRLRLPVVDLLRLESRGLIRFEKLIGNPNSRQCARTRVADSTVSRQCARYLRRDSTVRNPLANKSAAFCRVTPYAHREFQASKWRPTKENEAEMVAMWRVEPLLYTTTSKGFRTATGSQVARNLSVMVSRSAGEIALRSRVSSLMIIGVTSASIQSKIYRGMRIKFRYASSSCSWSPVTRLTNDPCSVRSSV